MSDSYTKYPIYAIYNENRFLLSEEFLSQFRGQQPQWGVLGYVTYLRTYSRPIYNSDGSFHHNEEFWETLKRVTEGTFTVLRQQVRSLGQSWDEEEATQKAEEFYLRMWQFKWLPPGRGLWAMGTEYVENYGGAALNNCGFVSTKSLDVNFADPFCALMDFSMLGVGMGFDVKGAGKVSLHAPGSRGKYVVQDTRESWVDLIRCTLNAYVNADGVLPEDIDYSKVRLEGAPIRGFGGTASGPGPLKDLVQSIREMLDANIGTEISSTLIVDLMNCIGRCVVAGNVRRSSEIAIGDATDEEFLALKDNSQIGEYLARQSAIENDYLLVREGRYQIEAIDRSLSATSVLSPAYASLLEQKDKLIAQKKEMLDAIPEYAELTQKINNHPLVRHRWASNNTVLCEVDQNIDPIADKIAMNGEPGVAWLDTIRAYGRLVDPPNHRDSKAEGFNPCAEQTLWDNELCCLVETFPTKHESLEDYLVTLKYAYLYAKVVTMIPTHRMKTNAVISRNRRIGTSMAGIAEMYLEKGLRKCIEWWDTSYNYIKELDKDYSGWMGIPESIKITSVKPGGTVPLLVGVEGGMKFTSSEYYIRTIRMDHMSPLVEKLRSAGYRIEKDKYTPRSIVAYFPVHAKQKRYARDISIWEQLALYVALQRYWSDNMVSATITFKPEESQDIARVLDVYSGQIKAISFLPLFDSQYFQAPYTSCTEDEYNQLNSRIDRYVSLRDLVIKEIAHAEEEKFCSGDKCEIAIGAELVTCIELPNVC